MSLKKTVRTISPVALAIVLVSCGSGSTDSPIDAGNENNAGNEPAIDAANATNEENSGASAQMVSGRVADGYIRGATVCVDLNQNDSCDTDEPSAITGPGGTYDLNISAEAQGYPIVADIPAEAIDEDTGEVIGKPLVFVAPADKPEFVSPITTLVHQELQSNPALAIDDAEDAVKNVLGVDESDVSLFADYVAGGNSDEEGAETKERFAFLHDTARVVASMMKDIETQVETAAVSDGVDVVGSEETQRAIRDIVRREVRQLLPEIAQQVAAIVESEEVEAVDAEEGSSGDLRPEFDPDQLAISLRPEGVADSIQEKIDAVVERVDPVQADIKQALTEGVYWIEFDCEYYEAPNIDFGVEQNFDEDGTVSQAAGEKCSAFYGTAKLNASGDQIESQDFLFDTDVGQWVEDQDEYDDYPSDFALVNGQWQEINESGPDGDVTFTDDGIAQISNSEGVMSLKAVTRSLDATEVLKHFLADDADDADDAWYSLAQSTDLFSAGAQSHTISVKQAFHPFVLFNAAAYDDAENACLEFSGNCNVVGVESEAEFRALNSLLELREDAIQGVQLSDNYSGVGPGANMKLMIDEDFDGTLPTSGSVEWTFDYDYYPSEYAGETGNSTEESDYESADKLYDEALTRVDGEVCYVSPVTTDEPVSPEPLMSPDEDIQRELQGDDVDPDEQDEEGQVVEELRGYYTECADPSVQSGSGKDETTMVSKWALIEVDGIEMIEIAMPSEFGGNGRDPQQAMLLIEHEGVVRLGARLSESFIDRVVTYNEVAFSTLRALIERASTQGQ